MADDIFRILQLAGLKRLDEEVSTNTLARDDENAFTKKLVPGRHASQSNWVDPKEDEEYDDRPRRMVQEEGDDEEMEEMPSEDETSEDETSEDVTVTLPRSAAEWLKDHLSANEEGCDECGVVTDALDEALCDDGECGGEEDYGFEGAPEEEEGEEPESEFEGGFM